MKMQFEPGGMIAQTASAPVSALVPVERGISPCQKYRVQVDGRNWMAKIFPGTALRVTWYEELYALRGHGLAVPEHVRLFDDGTLCVLAPWIEGDCLEDLLESASEAETRAFASQAARILERLHRKHFAFDAYPKRLAERVERVCREVEALPLPFPHAAECVAYLRGAVRERACGDVCLVHKDIRAENFIVRDGELFLIDFENGSLSEPAEDFTYLTTLGPPTHRRFARHVLEVYLEGTDPAPFWAGNLLYSALHVAEYALWKYQFKHRQVVHQAENLWRQYGGFTEPVPAWWRDAALQGDSVAGSPAGTSRPSLP